MIEGMRRAFRWFGGWLVKLTLVALLALFLAAAWASNYPDAPVVHRAMTLPVVGPWVARAYRLYRPPAPARAEPDTAELPVPPAPVEVGTQHVETRATFFVAPGAVVRRAPAHDAGVVAQLEVYANLKVLERRGSWHRVWRKRQGQPILDGWVHQPPAPPGEPLLGRDPEPPGPLMPKPPDPARLAAARSLLTTEQVRSLGPYALYTDSDNRILEDWLRALAGNLEGVYQQRFGRPLVGSPQAAVVLFATEDRYQRFQQGKTPGTSLVGLRTTGHAVGGIVALWTGGQDLAAVASTFVHEVVHLLNRRALGPALPPWLEEGLAEALDTAALAPNGTIRPKAIGGKVWHVGEAITWLGGRASLRQVQEAIDRGTLPTLRALTSLDNASFVRGPLHTLHYAQSGFFFRYLLDAEQGRHAPALRDFLDRVASGAPATGEALQTRLGVSWDVLDAGFQAWVASIENG